MATVSADRAAATFPVFSGTSGNLRVAYGVYTVASNLAAATIIRMCKVPPGSVVVGGWWMGADLDTGTEELDWDIGWEANGAEVADPDGFGNLGLMSGDVITDLKPVAGIWVPLQGVLLTAGPVTFTRETYIGFTVVVDAATGGTGVVTLVVLYAVP